MTLRLTAPHFGITIGVVVLLFYSWAEGKELPRFALTATSTHGQVGKPILVPLWVETGAPIAGLDFVVEWNADIFALDTATAGPLAALHGCGVRAGLTLVSGHVHAAVACGTAVEAEGVLVELHMRGLKRGTAEVRVIDCLVSGSPAQTTATRWGESVPVDCGARAARVEVR